MPGADTLSLDGDADFGVLLIHGFKSSPFEMSFLADFLNERFRCPTLVPRLAGHGTHIRHLNDSEWGAWDRSAEEAYRQLRERTERIIIIGMSMGGALAFRLAAKFGPIGVIAMGAPYQLPFKTRFAYLIRHFVSVYYDHQGPDISDLEMKKSAIRYSGIPLNAVCELRAMLSNTKPMYQQIHCPVALAHGRHDHVIPLWNLNKIAREIGPSVFDKRIFPNSYHIIPLDRDRIELYHWCAELIESRFNAQ